MVWHVRWSYVLSKLYGRLRLCHTHFTWHMTDSDSDSWVSDTDSDWVSVTDRLSVSVTDTFIDTVTDGKLLSLLSWKSTGYLLQMFTETATDWKYTSSLILCKSNAVNYNFVSFIDRQMTSLGHLQRRRGSLITQQAVSLFARSTRVPNRRPY